MIAVIFEVTPKPGMRDAYLETAARLRENLDNIDGFISVERFESLTQPGKLLSLSFWRDEQSIARWRAVEAHQRAQHAGRRNLFEDYRLRVAALLRDYGLAERDEAPVDARRIHG